MRVKALGTLSAALLVFSAVIFTSIIGNAQIPTPTANWVNIKDPKFGAIGDRSHDDTAAIQAAIDYAFAHNLTGVYCPAGTYKTSSTIYLDPPGNLRSNLSSPTNFAFSMSFFGDPAAAGNYQGCRLYPTFNNSIAFLIGTGQGMRVSDFAVIGPDNGYRGNLNSNGVGIGTAGGNGGSSINLIENTYIANFYNLYMADANFGCCLADSTTFRKVSGNNGFNGIWVGGETQAYATNVEDPILEGTTNEIYLTSQQPAVIRGGNLSATSGASNAFSISGTSSLSAINDPISGAEYVYKFTTTISSPDIYIPNVYNSFDIATAHFGVIPLLMTAWNASTNLATFQILPVWTFDNYPAGTNIISTTDIQNEIQAVSTLYAAERVTVLHGGSAHLLGSHIENPSACTTLLSTGGNLDTTIDDPYFDADPGLTQYAPSQNPTPAQLAMFYCQETFPFINIQGIPKVLLNGGNYSQNISTVGSPVIIDQNTGGVSQTPANLYVNNIQNLASPNVRIFGDFNNPNQDYLGLYGNFHGVGQWSSTPFYGQSERAQNSFYYRSLGEMSGPYCGWRPCPWTTPNLPPGLYSNASGTLGSLGSYPAINCETTYRSVDYNSDTLAHQFLRSASCPGFSWGQNLTNSLVNGTVTWLYKGQSNVLYLDSKTLGWMFPGLGIGLPNPNGGTAYYIVTGVYPDLGYITTYEYDGLIGNKTTVYSCSSGCTILQAPFAWTAY